MLGFRRSFGFLGMGIDEVAYAPRGGAILSMGVSDNQDPKCGPNKEPPHNQLKKVPPHSSPCGDFALLRGAALSRDGHSMPGWLYSRIPHGTLRPAGYLGTVTMGNG